MVKAFEFEHCEGRPVLVALVRHGVPLPLEVIAHFIAQLGSDQATTHDHGVTFHFPIEALQDAGVQGARIRAALDATNEQARLSTDQGMRDATLLAEDAYREVILN